MFARNKMCGSYTVYQKKERGKKYTKISKRVVHGKRPVILAHAQLGCWIDPAERGSLSRALISLVQQHRRPQRAELGLLCITRSKTQQAGLIYSLYLIWHDGKFPASRRRTRAKAKGGGAVYAGSKRQSVAVVERRSYIHQPVVLASCWMLQLQVTSLSNAVLLLFQHITLAHLLFASLSVSLNSVGAAITAKLFIGDVVF